MDISTQRIVSGRSPPEKSFATEEIVSKQPKNFKRKEKSHMKWYHVALALVGLFIASERLAKALNER